jgi:hypothetical protein
VKRDYTDSAEVSNLVRRVLGDLRGFAGNDDKWDLVLLADDGRRVRRVKQLLRGPALKAFEDAWEQAVDEESNR